MGSKTKTTTNVAPPSWAQGTINNALGAEQTGFNQGSSIFNQFQPSITGAIQNTANLASKPPQFQTDSQNLLDKTVNGDFLSPNSNPYATGMAKQIADQTQGGYNASFGGSGRAHGGMAALLSSQGVGNALNNFYGNIYSQERGNQQQALGMEPAMNADQYTGANQLINQTQTAAMTPEQLAGMFGQSVAGTVGPYGTTTSVQKTPFGLQQAIGLAMAAAGAATGNPMAAMGGLNMAGGSGGGGGGGMAGMIGAPVGSDLGGGINMGGGTANFFSHNPFGGI